MKRQLVIVALAAVCTVVLAGGCKIPQAGPTASEIASLGRAVPAPACITENMEARYAECPAIPRRSAAGDGCVAASPRPWLDSVPLSRPEVVELDAAVLGDRAARQLAGAEQRYREAHADASKWEDARNAYRRALRRLPADDLGYVYGAYKLALVQRALSDHEAAVAGLDAAIRSAGPRAAPELLRSARAELIDAFAFGANHSLAYRTFHPLSGDRDGETAATLHMMELLAATLARSGKLSGALTVLRELKRRDGGRACLHQSRMVEVSRDRGSRSATARELDVLLSDYRRLDPASPTHGACGAQAARLLLDLGATWQLEALGRDGRAGTRDPDTMSLAAQSFDATLVTFDQQQLDSWGICAPLSDVAFAHAELLYRMGDWQRCGPAYELALRIDPAAEHAPQASFAAVVCRQSAWDAQTRALAGLSLRQRMLTQIELADDWRLLLRAFYRYICTANGQEAKSAQYATAAYARAQAFYDGGAVWEAAVGFRMLAFEHSQSPRGALAARRYAQVMESLAADDVCRIDVMLDLERLIAAYCSQPSGRLAAACGEMNEVLERLGSISAPQL